METSICDSKLGRVVIRSHKERITQIYFDEDELNILHDNDSPVPKYLRDLALAAINGKIFSMPCEPQGTIFQLKVWEALRRIPIGKTATYAEIAKEIGHPKAVRAVGSACKLNPIAIVIPCHRVIRTNGDIGNYRWGVNMKRELLRREKEFKDTANASVLNRDLTIVGVYYGSSAK